MLQDTRILGINYNYFGANRLPKTRNGYSTYYFLLVVLRICCNFYYDLSDCRIFHRSFCCRLFHVRSFRKIFSYYHPYLFSALWAEWITPSCLTAAVGTKLFIYCWGIFWYRLILCPFFCEVFSAARAENGILIIGRSAVYALIVFFPFLIAVKSFNC